MDELKKAVSEADDEYLIGISNKGILKRAYKDLENAEITSGFIDTSADVTVDNVQCVIKAPLSESVCSCPSKSTCKHIVMSILWLKKEVFTFNKTEQIQENKRTPIKPENRESKLARELTEYPVEELKKAMKKQYYNSFLEKARVGIFPKMEEGTTITADIYEENVTVKLLSPIRYSACTCHSKELCKHKAAVILAWKLKHKVITVESLLPVEESVSVDGSSLKECAAHCLSFIERLISDGLVRTPDDISEYAESNALICHNADFPKGEKLMREIGNRLRTYNNHSPEFSTESLFSAIMDAYILMKNILDETNIEKLSELSGKFKSSYTISDKLEIIPVAQRKLSSIAGYEGDIYYFVNKSDNGGKLPFLTFSDIRPTFYDNNRRSQVSNAPWGLYGTCSTLMGSEMRLILPKLSGIKLSSSKETQAYQLCKPNLNQKAVYDKVYTDFQKLIDDNFAHTGDDESEILVMLMPEKCISSKFSEIEQTHTIVIEDFYFNRINIKARYKSKTKNFFAQLSDVGKTMLEHPEKHYVIFGNAYIENGECNIYPIAVFDNINSPVPDKKQCSDKKYDSDNKYIYFYRMFCDIISMLCDMTECGINSYDIFTQIKDSAYECENSGLTILSQKLNKLSELISAKNHTYSNDNTDIISLFGDIYSYLKTGRKKTELKCAVKETTEDNKNEFAE